MQLHIESIQAGFPDCIARQRVGGKERRIRIEFEFRSSNFRAHRHPVEGCDWIVCWEHDWADAPSNLKVVELSRYFGRGFNVWVIVSPPQDDLPARGKHVFGKRVGKGDLVLVYEFSPKMWFRHIYTVIDEGECKRYTKNKKGEKGVSYLHTIRRVCMLQPPLPMKVLQNDRLIPDDAIYGQKFNRKITEHWWRVHELIVRRNPDCTAVLERFSPSKV